MNRLTYLVPTMIKLLHVIETLRAMANYEEDLKNHTATVSK